MLTPDFSSYTCFLIITVWAFVEHIIMFTAISFTWSNPRFLKQLNFWEPFIPTLISIFSFHFFPSFFMISFKGIFKKRILHQQEAYAIPNTPSVWPLHVTPVPLVSCDHLKWWFAVCPALHTHSSASLDSTNWEWEILGRKTSRKFQSAKPKFVPCW